MDEVGKEGQNHLPRSLSAEEHGDRLVGSTGEQSTRMDVRARNV